jgi:hypothetical protein
LQASAQGATAVGEQAAQTLATVMANNTERMRIAAQMLTGVPVNGAGGGGNGSRPAKNVTEEGARLNFARKLDDVDATGTLVNGAGDAEAGGGGGGESGSGTASGGGQGDGGESTVASLFDRQTGGAFDDLAGQMVDSASDDGGGGASVQARPAPARKRRSTAKPKVRHAHVEIVCLAEGDVVEFTSGPGRMPVPFSTGDVFAQLLDGAGHQLFRTAGPDGFADHRGATQYSDSEYAYVEVTGGRLSIRLKYRHYDTPQPGDVGPVAAETPMKSATVVLPQGDDMKVVVDVSLKRRTETRLIASTSGHHDEEVAAFLNMNFPRPWRISFQTEDLGNDILKITVDRYIPALSIETEVMTY